MSIIKEGDCHYAAAGLEEGNATTSAYSNRARPLDIIATAMNHRYRLGVIEGQPMLAISCR